jgi:hypothetical protein
MTPGRFVLSIARRFNNEPFCWGKPFGISEISTGVTVRRTIAYLPIIDLKFLSILTTTLMNTRKITLSFEHSTLKNRK